jgi:hypothetical protein
MSIQAVSAQATFDFPGVSAPITVEAEVAWGNISVVGDQMDSVRLEVHYTDIARKEVSSNDIGNFVRIDRVANTLRLTGRKPEEGVFESIDLTLHVPSRARLFLRIDRGGEMEVSGMNNLVEINHRNGSVVLTHLGGFAVVSAVNGSIRAEFDDVTPGQSMSFITMNGGIDLSLPADLDANVRLRSQKNGYVVSDFALSGTGGVYDSKPDTQKGESQYSSNPIAVTSAIGSGGPWLVANTENGPIRLLRN